MNDEGQYLSRKYKFGISFHPSFLFFPLVDSDAEPLSSKVKKPQRKFGNPSANNSPGLSKRRGGGLGEGNGAQTDGDYNAHITEMKQGANNIMVSA